MRTYNFRFLFLDIAINKISSSRSCNSRISEMLTQMGNHACCLWKKSDDVKFTKFQADVNSPLY